MTPGFFELATVVLMAAALGIIARFLRQPTILAYLATGGLIAALGFFDPGGHQSLQLFSQLGVMFLLFLVGLEVNYTSLRLVGRASLFVGVGQVVFTAAAGLAITYYLLGMALLPALYVAVALTFSSTIIVVKLLSDKRDFQSLYGKLALGVLLVQDAVAVLLIIVLAGFGEPQARVLGLGGAPLAALGVVLALAMFWFGRRALPFVFDRVARSPELLFIAALAWVFAVAAVMSKLGFSLEVAGLLAGLALANSSERLQIASRVRALRDFFLIVFFVLLGASVALSDVSGMAVPIIALSLFVLVGNPLVVLVVMGLMGYRRRTSFLTGVAIAQISEFSFVLMALGFRLGHVGAAEVSLVTAVGAITITCSTYLITHAESIFRVLAPLLRVFERRHTRDEAVQSDGERKPIVLVGYHRTGQSIAAGLPREKLLVVEFDPEMVHHLKRHGFTYLFGDVADPEIFREAHIADAELLISTSPVFEDNLVISENLAHLPRRPRVVLRAETEEEAAALYARGADYVLLPHLTAGQYLGKTIAIDPAMRILEELREKDRELLKRIHE
ncbi:MAG: cation:proton antiporter [Candidatus Jorgensenbacteria bacterium]